MSDHEPYDSIEQMRADDLHPKVLAWTRKHHPERLQSEDRESARPPDQRLADAIEYVQSEYIDTQLGEPDWALTQVVAAARAAVPFLEGSATAVALSRTVTELAEALKGVSNAYGCFAGCHAGTKGWAYAENPAAHTPTCRAARQALASVSVPPQDTNG